MTVGLTYDLREDYGIEKDSMIYADFVHPDEIGYIESAIQRNGFDTLMIGNMYKLAELIKTDSLNCDIVFVLDEGIASRNREIMVPALLELNKIPYIGSDAYCMGLSQNKYHTKLVAEALGITCPEGIYLDYETDNGITEKELSDRLKAAGLDFPLLVKPNEEGYSMGVFLVHDAKELMDAVKSDFGNYHEPVLIEEFIDGKEIYVPIIGTGKDAYTLPVGRVASDDGSDVEIYCVEDKCYDWSHYEAAELPEDVTKRLEDDSLKLYRHLGCVDLGRCDFRLRKDGTPVMIEITPRPGLTEEGPFESSIKAAGRTYDELLKEIIVKAAERYGLTA